MLAMEPPEMEVPEWKPLAWLLEWLLEWLVVALVASPLVGLAAGQRAVQPDACSARGATAKARCPLTGLEATPHGLRSAVRAPASGTPRGE